MDINVKIAQALGITDTEDIVALTLNLRVDSWPEITVIRHLVDYDAEELKEVLTTYTLNEQEEK